MKEKISKSILENSSLYNKILNKYDPELGSQVYPLNVKEISDKLKIRVKNSTYHSSTEFLQRHLRDEYLCLEKFNDVLHNGGLNPHDEEYDSIKYFVKSDHLTEIKETILFYLMNIKDYNKPIIQCGEKGVGKTLLQNIILYESTEDLENNKIFWVRCDAHKLYELWSSTHSTRATIDDYHQLQLLYVFSKYYKDIPKRNNNTPKKSSKSKMFSEIFNLIITRENNSDVFCKENSIRHLIDGKYVYLKLSKSIEKFRNELIIAENGKKKNYSYMLHKLLTEYQSNVTNEDKSFSKWKETANSLINFLAQEDYIILNIVDGIDNLNFSGDPRTINYYHLMLEKIANLVYLKPNLDNIRTYFCMREDTLCELRSKLVCSSNTDGRYYNEDQIITIYQEKPLYISKVLNKRIDYFLEKYKTNSLIREPQSLKLFCDLKDIYLGENYLHENYKSINSYISKMSIRDFLHFQYGMVRLILLRKNQSKVDYSISTKNQYYRYFKRNLFLNGRLFLNSNRSDFLNSNEGRSYYNIFSNSPHLLCTLRILQILSITSIDRSRLILILQYLFDYPLSTLNNSLSNLYSFNLIKPRINKNKINENIYCSNQYSKLKYNENELIDYTITEKGKTITTTIFSDIEILYLLSLDTQVPEWFIPDFIDSVDNNPDARSYYNPNCLKSGVSFLNLLKVIDKKEIKKVEGKINEYSKNQILNSTSKIRDIIEKIKKSGLGLFSIEKLIDYRALSDQINALYYKMNVDEEKKRLENFLNIF